MRVETLPFAFRNTPRSAMIVRAALLLFTVTNAAVAQSRQNSLATTPVLPKTRVEGAVKVHEHDRTALTRATQLELVGPPLTVLGGTDAEYDLTYAEHIALLSDGRISTLSAVGNKYLVFGTDGRLQRTLSRQGKGPGEIMAPSGNRLLAHDTLFISDAANQRFSWFSPDKGYVRGKAIPVNVGMSRANVVGILPGNHIVMSSMGLVQNAESEKVERPAAPVSVIRSDGNVQKIAELPDVELVKLNTVRRGRPQSETHVIRFSRRALVAVWDSNIVTGIGDGYRLDVRNSTGSIGSRIVVDVPRTPVTKAMREASIQTAMQRRRNTRGEGSPTSTAADLEKIERDTPAADSLPPYMFFTTSPNNTLWVIDVRGDFGGAWSATAFRKDGAIVGRLSVPSGGFPLAFGNDRVAVRTEDADGVVTLSVRRIGVVGAKPN